MPAGAWLPGLEEGFLPILEEYEVSSEDAQKLCASVVEATGKWDGRVVGGLWTFWNGYSGVGLLATKRDSGCFWMSLWGGFRDGFGMVVGGFVGFVAFGMSLRMVWGWVSGWVIVV